MHTLCAIGRLCRRCFAGLRDAVAQAKSKPPLLFAGQCEADDLFLYFVLEYATADLHSVRRLLALRKSEQAQG